MQQKYLTKEEALQKLRHYCGYMERCHYDISKKLYNLGVYKSLHDEIISTLIEENYLNEERFAKLFAGGKFRINEWGRNKIVYELKGRKVSPYIIKMALKEIDEEEYRKTLAELAQKKYDLLKNEQYMERRKKTVSYMLQKGFEHELIAEAMKKII